MRRDRGRETEQPGVSATKTTATGVFAAATEAELAVYDELLDELEAALDDPMALSSADWKEVELACPVDLRATLRQEWVMMQRLRGLQPFLAALIQDVAQVE